MRSRFAPGFETSQAGRYERWKGQIRHQFFAKGYDKLPGVPFFEPVLFISRTYASTNFVEKDASNTVKAIEDALNPLKLKPTKGRSAVFRRHAWDDDKIVRLYGSGTGIYPCKKGEDRVEVEIQPLFGREYGMISYLRGIPVAIDDDEGFVTIMTRADYGFNVLLPPRVMADLTLEKPEEERKALHLYIHPHVYGDNTMTFVFFGFETKEELRVFRDIIRVDRVGPSLAFRFLHLPLNLLLPAIADKDIKTLTQIKGVGTKVAEKVIDKLCDKSYVPQVTNGVNVDEEKIEKLVGSIHELWGYPVSKTRQWLLDQALDYSLPFQALFSKVSATLMANRGLS